MGYADLLRELFWRNASFPSKKTKVLIPATHQHICVSKFSLGKEAQRQFLDLELNFEDIHKSNSLIPV